MENPNGDLGVNVQPVWGVKGAVSRTNVSPELPQVASSQGAESNSILIELDRIQRKTILENQQAMLYALEYLLGDMLNERGREGYHTSIQKRRLATDGLLHVIEQSK